jgi:hypothetical protein
VTKENRVSEMGGNAKVTATIIAIAVGLLLVIGVICWFLWPTSNYEVSKTEAKIDGNGNKVITDSHREWAIFRIEHLEAGAVRRTWTGVIVVILVLGGLILYGCHYKIIRKPRNDIRDNENEMRGTEMKILKYDLTEAGYLHRKRPIQKKLEKSKKPSVIMKKNKINKRIEEDDEEEEV